MTESKDPPITAGTIEPRATAVYALGSNPAESARLRRQSDELRPYSAELLDRVGLQPGQTAIDLGCGPCGILQLLSERVSPGGRVVGADADPTHVTMATQFADEQGLRNVEIIEADAGHTGLPSRSFDLVHSRTLLVTIPEPATAVAEMVRLARPGGWVASLEPDTEHGLCYPGASRLRTARRALWRCLPAERCRSLYRPPVAGAISQRRAPRHRGGGARADTPAR